MSRQINLMMHLIVLISLIALVCSSPSMVKAELGLDGPSETGESEQANNSGDETEPQNACLAYSFVERETKSLDTFVQYNVWARSVKRRDCHDCCKRNKFNFGYWTFGHVKHCICTDKLERLLFSQIL